MRCTFARAAFGGSPRSADASWSLEGVRPSASRAARASRRDHDDMAGAREKGRDVHGVGGGGSSGGERSQGPTVHHGEPRATRGRDARALGVRRRVWRRRIASYADLSLLARDSSADFFAAFATFQQTVYPWGKCRNRRPTSSLDATICHTSRTITLYRNGFPSLPTPLCDLHLELSTTLVSAS